MTPLLTVTPLNNLISWTAIGKSLSMLWWELSNLSQKTKIFETVVETPWD